MMKNVIILSEHDEGTLQHDADTMEAFLELLRNPVVQASFFEEPVGAELAVAMSEAERGNYGDEQGYANIFAATLSDPVWAELILQMPNHVGGVDEERVNKLLALTVAEYIGPDHAQALYRFAVLVTKLA